MKETPITFDTAKLAKEKGFDVGVWDCYNAKGKVIDYSRNIYPYTNDGKFYSCCSQDLLHKWLREKHNIYVISNRFSKGFVRVANEKSKGTPGEIIYKEHFADVFKVEDDGEKFTNTRTIFGDSYDDAFELGLQFALSRI